MKPQFKIDDLVEYEKYSKELLNIGGQDLETKEVKFGKIVSVIQSKDGLSYEICGASGSVPESDIIASYKIKSLRKSKPISSKRPRKKKSAKLKIFGEPKYEQIEVDKDGMQSL